MGSSTDARAVQLIRALEANHGSFGGILEEGFYFLGLDLWRQCRCGNRIGEPEARRSLGEEEQQGLLKVRHLQALVALAERGLDGIHGIGNLKGEAC